LLSHHVYIFKPLPLKSIFILHLENQKFKKKYFYEKFHRYSSKYKKKIMTLCFLKTCYSSKYKQKIRVTIENRKKKKRMMLLKTCMGCKAVK